MVYDIDNTMQIGQVFSDGRTELTVLAMPGSDVPSKALRGEFWIVIVHKNCGEVANSTMSIADYAYMKKDMTTLEPVWVRVERELIFHRNKCPKSQLPEGNQFLIYSKHDACDFELLNNLQIELTERMGKGIKASPALLGVDKALRFHFIPCYQKRRERLIAQRQQAMANV